MGRASSFSSAVPQRERLKAECMAILLGLSIVSLGVILMPRASADTNCNGVVPHGAVLIRSNADFTAANGVVSGTGTAPNPYLIANLAVNDLTPGYGLKVDNSKGKITASFDVQCVTSNWAVFPSTGAVVVWIVNVHATTTIVNVISNAGEAAGSIGIRLDASSHILLTGENIDKFNGDGIQLNGSDHITVVSSKLKAFHNGLTIQGSHDIVVGQDGCKPNACLELTYDNGRGLQISNSYDIVARGLNTSADDTGGILLDGSGTFNVFLWNGTATADGPICPSGAPTGETVDTIAGITATNGAHDITVRGYTINANGDGFGGFFDLMNGGNGGYLNPCTKQIIRFKQATAPGGANLDFNDNCYHFEFNFNPVPTTTCS